MFYKHEGEESYLVPFMREYWLINIQYIHNIKKNMFKLENIMKLSIRVRRTRKAAKSLKISINGLEIETKEEDCTSVDAKSIIPLLRAFYMYTQILIFLAAPGNKLQLQLPLGKYVEYLMMLQEMYTWDSVQAYYFNFHQTQILERIDDVQAQKMPDYELKQYLLVAQPVRNTNLHDSQNIHMGGNSFVSSIKVCFKWNLEKNYPSNCKFLHQCTNCMGNHTKRRCSSRSITSSFNNVNTTPVSQRQQQPQYTLKFISKSFSYSVTNLTNTSLYKPGLLSIKGQKTWLKNYLDKTYQEKILSIIICGAKIGYCGPKQKIISDNLPLATNDPDTLTADLKNQIAADQLTKVSDMEDYFIFFLLGLAPKSNSKWRQIHHLLYPHNYSVNCYILKKQGTLEYTIFDKAK